MLQEIYKLLDHLFFFIVSNIQIQSFIDARRKSCLRPAWQWLTLTVGSRTYLGSELLTRTGRFGYLFVESTGISGPLPAAEPRLGRRTVLTFPLLPPPQKN